MKRRTVFFVTVLTIFLLVVISSVVLADRGAIHCDLDITYDDWGDGMYWYGTIDGPECTEDTDAQWDHMVGYQYHEMGVTGDPSVLPVEAPGGSATLAPGGRPVDPPDNLCAPPEREG